MTGPLSGCGSSSLTGVVSGPFATMFLADQGADVLKIEPIGGDITRRSRATIDKSRRVLRAVHLVQPRQALAVDRHQERGRPARSCAKLVAQADVLVQNFRPGTMERLGLGADELRQRHPRLIYVSISGVGDTGPYVKKRVYDPIIQGLSGFADIQSQPVTNRPQMIRTIVCDKTTAVFTAQAVSSALYAREKTGQGDHIQVAMLDAMISYLWPEGMMQYTVVGAEAAAARSQRASRPRVQDQRRLHHRRHHLGFRMAGLLPAVGQPELAKDKRFSTPAARTANASRAHQHDGRILAKHTTAEWLKRLDAADVPCAPILRRGEIMHNEQVVARGLIAEFDHPGSDACGSRSRRRSSAARRPERLRRRRRSASTAARSSRAAATRRAEIDRLAESKVRAAAEIGEDCHPARGLPRAD